jgi:hypothetical protein
VLEKRKIKNVDFDTASWLISTGKDLAVSFAEKVEGSYPKDLWIPVRRYLHSVGCATATVSAVQTNHARRKFVAVMSVPKILR